jgi:tetratricopeptide (TPR) repeat protein
MGGCILCQFWTYGEGSTGSVFASNSYAADQWPWNIRRNPGQNGKKHMTPEDAKTHCAKHGSVLRHYEQGRVASIVLASGEALTLSIGTATAKIFMKRAVLGWLLPKTVGEKNLADWVPEYRKLSSMQRSIARAIVLDGLVSLAARAKYAGELSLAWTVLRNPVEVAVEECGWGLNQEQEAQTAEEQGQSRAPIEELGIQTQEMPVRPGSLLEKAQEVSGKFIVSFYRQLGASNRCPPTTNTSDQKIVEIYSLVGSAFQAAAKRRGERVPAIFLNRIVSGFLQIYEGKGEDFMQEHLQYEIEKYLREGLRPDYRQPLPFFSDDEMETREGPCRDEAQPDADAWLSKGDALSELGRPEQAIAWFDKALAINPRLAKAWFGKGNALFRLGRLDEAKTCLGKAIEIDPQCVAAWAGGVINKAHKHQLPGREG